MIAVALTSRLTWITGKTRMAELGDLWERWAKCPEHAQDGTFPRGTSSSVGGKLKKLAALVLARTVCSPSGGRSSYTEVDVNAHSKMF